MYVFIHSRVLLDYSLYLCERCW